MSILTKIGLLFSDRDCRRKLTDLENDYAHCLSRLLNTIESGRREWERRLQDGGFSPEQLDELGWSVQEYSSLMHQPIEIMERLRTQVEAERRALLGEGFPGGQEQQEIPEDLGLLPLEGLQEEHGEETAVAEDGGLEDNIYSPEPTPAAEDNASNEVEVGPVKVSCYVYENGQFVSMDGSIQEAPDYRDTDRTVGPNGATAAQAVQPLEPVRSWQFKINDDMPLPELLGMDLESLKQATDIVTPIRPESEEEEEDVDKEAETEQTLPTVDGSEDENGPAVSMDEDFLPGMEQLTFFDEEEEETVRQEDTRTKPVLEPAAEPEEESEDK